MKHKRGFYERLVNKQYWSFRELSLFLSSKLTLSSSIRKIRINDLGDFEFINEVRINYPLVI